MFKKGQQGELAITISLLALFVALIGVTAGNLSSRSLNSKSSSAQGFFSYKSTLEVRDTAGNVIQWEPEFTWDNGLQGQTRSSGDINMPPNPLARLIYDASNPPGVPLHLQNITTAVVVRVPEAKWDVVGAFCTDIKGTTCKDTRVTIDYRTRSNIKITNGADILYGIVVQPKGTPPTPMPTSIPVPTTTPVQPTVVPTSTPVQPTLVPTLVPTAMPTSTTIPTPTMPVPTTPVPTSEPTIPQATPTTPPVNDDLIMRFDTTTGNPFYDEVGTKVTLNFYADGDFLGDEMSAQKDSAGVLSINTGQLYKEAMSAYVEFQYKIADKYMPEDGDPNPIYVVGMLTDQGFQNLIATMKAGGVIKVSDLVSTMRGQIAAGNSLYFDLRPDAQTQTEGANSNLVVNINSPVELSGKKMYLDLAMYNKTDTSLFNKQSWRNRFGSDTDWTEETAFLSSSSYLTGKTAYRSFSRLRPGWYVATLWFDPTIIAPDEISIDGCQKIIRTFSYTDCLVDMNTHQGPITVIYEPLSDGTNSKGTEVSFGSNLVKGQGDQIQSSVDYTRSSIEICSSTGCKAVSYSASGVLDMEMFTKVQAELGVIQAASCAITFADGITAHCPKVGASSYQRMYVQLSSINGKPTAEIVGETSRADGNGDGEVNGFDLSGIIEGYATPDGDITGDGKTDARDLTIGISWMGRSTVYLSEFEERTPGRGRK